MFRLFIFLLLLSTPAISVAEHISKIDAAKECDVPDFDIKCLYTMQRCLLDKKIHLFKTIIKKYSEPDSISESTSNSLYCIKRRVANLKAILEQLFDDVAMIVVRIDSIVDDLYARKHYIFPKP